MPSSEKALAMIEAMEREEDERRVTIQAGVIPTGLPSFDDVLGVGGIPRGHITHCCGQNYSGKSVTWCHFAESVTSHGGNVGIVDLDRSMHMKYIRAIGVDMREATFIRAVEIERITRALNIAVDNETDLFVIDSLAAIPAIPMLDTHELGRILDITSGSRTAVVIANQDRMTSRGMMPCYHEVMDAICPITFYLRTKGHIVDTGRIVGHNVEISVIKNRFTGSSDPVSMRLIYGRGFDITDSRIDAMITSGSVIRRGSWYEFEGENYQGREELRRFMEVA